MSLCAPSNDNDISKNLLAAGSHTVELNGVQLHYHVQGNGPLLFTVSPGWGVGSAYLRRGLDFLLTRFTVVFVDTRGSGLSGRPTDETKMGSNEMAEDLEALRAYLGLTTIELLGHSNGGAIALSFAQRYPNRVSRLMLIDSQVLGFSATEDTQAFLVRWINVSCYANAAQRAIGLFSGEVEPPTNDHELSQFVGDILPLYLHNPEKNLPAARQQLLDGQVVFYAFHAQNIADAAAKNDQLRLLSLIDVPVFIASGRHDWICPVAVAERLHAGIATSKLVIFEESGHFPWIEESDKFQAQLLAFLEQ